MRLPRAVPRGALGLIAAVVAVAVAACNGGNATAPGATNSTATPPTRLGATQSDAAVNGASDDPHVGDAKDANDFIHRLVQLQNAIFPNHARLPSYQLGSTTRGVTNDSIKVGIVATLTTADGSEPSAGVCEGTLARLHRVNVPPIVNSDQDFLAQTYAKEQLDAAYEGVSGRTIEVVGPKNDRGLPCQDDHADANRNRQLVEDLVDKENAFALVSVTSQVFSAADYLNQQHVPYFGATFETGYCGSDFPFGMSTSGAGPCDELKDRLRIGDSRDATYSTQSQSSYQSTAPAFTRIRKDLDAAGFPSVPITKAVVDGWASADMFLHAVSKAPEPLTAEELVNFMNGGDYAYPGLAGLICPVVLPLGHVTRMPCDVTLRVDATSQQDGPPAKVGPVGTGSNQAPVVNPSYSMSYLDLSLIPG